MEKIITLANRLDEAGRFDEADFVTRRVAAAAVVIARREAQAQQPNQQQPAQAYQMNSAPTANYGHWWANAWNATAAGANNLFRGQDGVVNNLNSLYNQTVGLSQQASTNNGITPNLRNILINGFNEIAAALAPMTQNNTNAHQFQQTIQPNQQKPVAPQQQQQEQQPTQAPAQQAQPSQQQPKQASSDTAIRIASMQDISGIEEALRSYQAYAAQILTNVNPNLLRWIGQKLSYMTAAVNQEKSGVKSTNEGDWFTQNNTNLQTFVGRVQKWVNEQRQKGVQNPQWQARLKQNGIPDQIAAFITPYVK
jgi:hypothetical protein